MTIKRDVTCCLIPLILWFGTACSLARSTSQVITIIPSHPNAEVTVDGQPRGTGTMTVDLKRNRSHSVMARCGNSSGVALVDRNLSTTGLLDLIGGFLILIPFLGLVAPGAWDLSPTAVSVPVPDASACERS